jgi:hypothetical protein
VGAVIVHGANETPVSLAQSVQLRQLALATSANVEIHELAPTVQVQPGGKGNEGGRNIHWPAGQPSAPHVAVQSIS